MLALIGTGFSIGNVVGGRFADRSLDGSLIGFLVLLIAVMLAFPTIATSHVGAAIGLLVWGIATFAVVPPLQMRMMRAAAEAPGLASSVNVGAFNLGNALGAAAGGATISTGFGYSAAPIAGALIAAAGLALVLIQIARQRQRLPARGRHPVPQSGCMAAITIRRTRASPKRSGCAGHPPDRGRYV